MLVSNDFEYSVSISQDTDTIDVCAFRQDRQLTIGLHNGSGDPREIVLSPDEARQLREHLNDPTTMAILGIKDIDSVKCPVCSQMVHDARYHPCFRSTNSI